MRFYDYRAVHPWRGLSFALAGWLAYRIVAMNPEIVTINPQIVAMNRASTVPGLQVGGHCRIANLYIVPQSSNSVIPTIGGICSRYALQVPSVAVLRLQGRTSMAGPFVCRCRVACLLHSRDQSPNRRDESPNRCDESRLYRVIRNKEIDN